jgi:hypothetical protein
VSPTGQSSREEDSVSEFFAYRANDELATAWRDLMAKRDQHIETVVRPFQEQHPNNHPLVDSWEKVLGFADGDRKNSPPAGLSRSQRRSHLIPVRGRAGDVWREHMARLALPATRYQLLRDFGLKEQMYSRNGQTFLGRPDALDFGEDGVFVYTGYEIADVPECLTPVKRSEFYAAQERAVERQERSGVSS